ncbi:MAG: hypothetical protein K9H64_02105 [Bacteroidales bacterium]|nr:hypothetical protein [Bacteroidales bacterium]MCF8454660.1 hypothetical protein [Bacteroidales bacterium]
MLQKGFLKPELSIEILGRKQFWTGVFISIGCSFVLSYLINYTRETYRFITFFYDPIILSYKEFRLYDLFFASLATSLGFGFTIIYWLIGPNRKIKKRYFKRFTVSTSWMIIFVVLMITNRFSSVLYIILFGLPGFDNHLDFLQDFSLLFILIPIYVFFSHWNSIRLLFRTGNWMLISIALYCLTTFYLFQTTSVDKEKLNKVYYAQQKERYDFIDKEFENARKSGIFFSDSLKQILQKQYAERTTNFVYKLRSAFK